MEGSTQLNSSLLTISVIAVLLPAAFHFALTPDSGQTDQLTDSQERKDILAVSHGVCYSSNIAVTSRLIILHRSPLFCSSVSSINFTLCNSANLTIFRRCAVYGSYLVFQLVSHKNLYHEHHGDVARSVKYGIDTIKEKKKVDASASSSAGNGNPDVEAASGEGDDEEKEEEEEEPEMGLWVSIALLVVVTVVSAIFSIRY